MKSKTVIRAKEGHYKMIKGSIQQEYITIINLFTPNSRVCKYTKQTLTEVKKEIDSNNNSEGFQYPTFNNRQSDQTKDQ